MLQASQTADQAWLEERGVGLGMSPERLLEIIQLDFIGNQGTQAGRYLGKAADKCSLKAAAFKKFRGAITPCLVREVFCLYTAIHFVLAERPV